jgi:hypothetical protein
MPSPAVVARSRLACRIAGTLVPLDDGGQSLSNGIVSAAGMDVPSGGVESKGSGIL